MVFLCVCVERGVGILKINGGEISVCLGGGGILNKTRGGIENLHKNWWLRFHPVQ